MALVVETGAGDNPDADSYISEAGAILLAGNFGLDFPVDETEAEVPLRMAAKYLETLRLQYQGTKYYAGQSLQWPRNPVFIDGEKNDPTNIPGMLIEAQVVLASVMYDGGTLFGTGTGSATSRSVGDVSITNTNGGSLTNATYSGLASELLSPLLKSAKNGLLEFDVCRA